MTDEERKKAWQARMKKSKNVQAFQRGLKGKKKKKVTSIDDLRELAKKQEEKSN